MPAEIGQLTKLQTLDLDSNHLSDVPAEIGQLRNLRELDLYRNQLKEVPAAIGHLTNLQKLYLSGNQLSEVPADLFSTQHAASRTTSATSHRFSKTISPILSTIYLSSHPAASPSSLTLEAKEAGGDL